MLGIATKKDLKKVENKIKYSFRKSKTEITEFKKEVKELLHQQLHAVTAPTTARAVINKT